MTVTEQVVADKPAIDPVTFEIIQNSLTAISDEMFAVMRKTAMSAIIYEVLDMATGVCDAEGEIASSGAGIPAFVGVLDKTVKAILRKHGLSAIRPGDIFATNDPFYGGVTHLNDIILAMPVFVEDRLVAWAADIAHWNDIGGMVPGGMSNEAREIFQEGIRLPAIRLFDEGRENVALMEVLSVNSRLPDYLRGDLWAGIAAVRLGERRLRELALKYGVENFLATMAALMDHGEKRTLAGLADLRPGRYEMAEEQDDGAIWHVAVEVAPDRFTVDLREAPDEAKAPYNASRDGATIAAQLVLKAVTDPELPTNGGTFRPLSLLTRPGSIFDASETAAYAFYCEVEIRLYDLLLRCLAQAMPERFSAGHFSSICGTVVGGPHPDTGRHYTIVEPEMGGWGAQEGADGNDVLFSQFHGETYNCPAEVAEARYGLDVDYMTFNPEPGGEGRWRGGRGIRMAYRARADSNFLTIGYSRARSLPWGIAGGRDGTANYVDVIRTDGTTSRHALATNIRLDRGDIVRITTGNGAGYGDPAERDRAAVADDILRGFLTPERAAEVYGYVAEDKAADPAD